MIEELEGKDPIKTLAGQLAREWVEQHPNSEIWDEVGFWQKYGELEELCGGPDGAAEAFGREYFPLVVQTIEQESVSG